MASLRRAHPSATWSPPGGPSGDVPVVVPTQFVLEGETVWLHLVRANPVFAALAENPRVLLSVADDWAFIPSSWKAIGDEDPALGIPTTYYGAVQLTGTATVLRRAHGAGQRGRDPAAPAGHASARRRGGRSGRGACGQAVGNPRDLHRRRAGVGQIQVRRQRRRCASFGCSGTTCANAVRPATSRQPTTWCSDWPPSLIPPSVRQGRAVAATSQWTPPRTGAITEPSSQLFGRTLRANSSGKVLIRAR